MPRRCNNDTSSDEGPPRKRACNAVSFDLRHGECPEDITGKRWRLGKTVGWGGFGEIYQAQDDDKASKDTKYVAKVERHTSGPLFVEINCYLRIAKAEMINEWKESNKLKSLGMPNYVASGSHIHKGERFRFLILPKFEKDLERVLDEKKILNLKTVLTISIQIIDVLEYIHGKGYVHSDIKASNILFNTSTAKAKQKRQPCNKLYSNAAATTAAATATNNNSNSKDSHHVQLTTVTRNLRPTRHDINYLDDIPDLDKLLEYNLVKKDNHTRRNKAKSPERRSCRNNNPSNLRKTTTRQLRPKDRTVNYLDDIPNFDDIVTDDGWHFAVPALPNSNSNHSNNNTSNSSSSSCNNSNTADDVTEWGSECDQVYLFDYGLACRYLKPSGEHKPYCVDQRKAHAGTILFCSRDAHKGVQSRRSDLESLGYNLMFWLCGSLPWLKDAEDPEIVARRKQRFINNPEKFFNSCFVEYPTFLMEYFQYLQKLQFQEKPDYNHLKKILRSALKEYGYKDDGRLDFDNLEGWGKKEKKLMQQQQNNNTTNNNNNTGNHEMMIAQFVYDASRLPLQSNNIFIKPVLRKKVKNKQLKNLIKWSQILVDPEFILKQARERKNVESGGDSGLAASIADMDIGAMNPTYAMLEVYNRCRERAGASPNCREESTDNIDGYTAAMTAVLKRKEEREELEAEQAAVILRNQSKCVKMAKRSANNGAAKRRRGRPESPIKYSTLPLKHVKSAAAVAGAAQKRDNPGTKRLKGVTIPLKRTYSLRG